MATNTSEHLGLNLWEPDDQVLREEFNENWEKLDEETADIRADMADSINTVMTAMGSGGQTARIAYGSYVGSGGAKTLTFPFKPVFVAIGGGTENSDTTDIFMVHGASKASFNSFGPGMANITWGGSSGQWTVTFSYNGTQFHNYSGRTYYYIAIGVSE